MPGVTSLNSSARSRDAGPGNYVTNLKTITASLTMDTSQGGQYVVIDAAAGLTCTLPTATGSGNVYRFFIKTTVTSNNVVIQVNNSTDAFAGFNNVISDDAGGPAKGFIASAGSDDTITLNGTTKGGYAGDFIEIVDIASGLFAVQIYGKATGTEATPFSAAV